MFSSEGVFNDIVTRPERILSDPRRIDNHGTFAPIDQKGVGEFTLCYSRDESPNIGVYCESGYNTLTDIRRRERELTIKDAKITAFGTHGKVGKQKLFTL